MIADTIKPNIAIVTDVTHDTTTPMIEKKKKVTRNVETGLFSSHQVFIIPSEN
jgi:putative aminopeptidase FrvX